MKSFILFEKNNSKGNKKLLDDAFSKFESAYRLNQDDFLLNAGPLQNLLAIQILREPKKTIYSFENEDKAFLQMVEIQIIRLQKLFNNTKLQQYLKLLIDYMLLNRFPKLKLNIAHFGSKSGWLPCEQKKYMKGKYQDRKNIIIGLMRKYENVYADFSYSFAEPELLGPLNLVMADDYLRSRIMFGTDYWVVYNEGDLGKKTDKFLESLKRKEWKEELCITNPKRYLFDAAK